MSKINLTRAQADFLANLKANAEAAQMAFAVALNALGLAVDRNGQVTYDLGPEPWIDVKVQEPKGD